MLNIRQESSQHPGLLLIWFEPGVEKQTLAAGGNLDPECKLFKRPPGGVSETFSGQDADLAAAVTLSASFLTTRPLVTQGEARGSSIEMFHLLGASPAGRCWAFVEQLLHFVHDKPCTRVPRRHVWTCVRARGGASLISVFNVPTRWQSCLAHERSERAVASAAAPFGSTSAQPIHETVNDVTSRVRTLRSRDEGVIRSATGAEVHCWQPRQEEAVWALMKKNGGRAGSSRLFSLDSPFKRIHGCVHAHYVNNSSLK